MKKSYLLIAVALPFVLLCLLIVRAEYHTRMGEHWNFAITGYDPRDLLRGHYLQFQVAYDWDAQKNTCEIGPDCCLCLNKTELGPPKVSQQICAIAKLQCDGSMQSQAQGSLNRFYIAETDALRAEKILIEARANNNAFITLSINQKGEPQIVDLLIGDQSIEAMLESTKRDELHRAIE